MSRWGQAKRYLLKLCLVSQENIYRYSLVPPYSILHVPLLYQRDNRAIMTWHIHIHIDAFQTICIFDWRFGSVRLFIDIRIWNPKGIVCDFYYCLSRGQSCRNVNLKNKFPRTILQVSWSYNRAQQWILNKLKLVWRVWRGSYHEYFALGPVIWLDFALDTIFDNAIWYEEGKFRICCYII